MPRYRYSLYGLVLESEIPFPELPAIRRKRPLGLKKIRIVTRTFRVASPEGSWERLYGLKYQLSPDHRWTLISSPFAGNFRVWFRERKIEWSPSRRSSLGFARLVLRGRALGLLLPFLKPSLLLHANVLVTRDGEGIAFCGIPGAGKSSLAAYCLNDGFALLSDDVAVIEKQKRRFWVEPGAPEIRLWPDAGRQFPPAELTGEVLFPETSKRRFRLEETAAWRFVKRRVPLRMVYFLSRLRGRRGEVRIEDVPGKEGLLQILRNLYNPMLNHPKALREQLDLASEFPQKVPLKHLVFPSGWGRLPDVHQAILKDLSL